MNINIDVRLSKTICIFNEEIGCIYVKISPKPHLPDYSLLEY